MISEYSSWDNLYFSINKIIYKCIYTSKCLYEKDKYMQ